jgi:hypothetical protein
MLGRAAFDGPCARDGEAAAVAAVTAAVVEKKERLVIGFMAFTGFLNC